MKNAKVVMTIEGMGDIGLKGVIESLKSSLPNIYGTKYIDKINDAIDVFIDKTTSLALLSDEDIDVQNHSNTTMIDKIGYIEFSYVYIFGVNQYSYTVRVFHALQDEPKLYTTHFNSMQAYQTYIKKVVNTPTGEMTAEPMDYIIIDKNGDAFPCHRMLFERIFREVPNYDKKSIETSTKSEDYISDQIKNTIDSYLNEWGYHCTCEALPMTLIDRIVEFDKNKDKQPDWVKVNLQHDVDLAIVQSYIEKDTVSDINKEK